MEVVNISVNDLVPYKKNPRRNDEAVRGVARSIEEFGFKVPIVIDKDKVIIAGHTRLKAAKHLGMKEVPCIVADDLTDEQIKAFRLADNRVSEVSQWDENLLDIELEELAEIGFDMTAFDFDLDFDLEAWNIDSDSKSNDKEEIDYKEATQHLTENILNLGYAQYAGAGLYDIPILAPVRHIPKIEEWVGFNYALTATNRKKKGVHFYVDDYQFERVWNRPEAYLDVLSQFGAWAILESEKEICQ